MNGPIPTARWGRRFLFGYLPFTAVALGLAFAIVAASESWVALLAGGVVLLAWSLLVLITQLPILLVKYDSRFLLKASAITLFNLFGTPFLVAALWTGIDSLVLGEPDVEQHIKTAGSGRCNLIAIQHAKRVGRDDFQISGTVQCQGLASQYCVWWFVRRDGQWRIPDSPHVGCPRISSGRPLQDEARNAV
jgi:hypothetical protein